jgi:hypothetical protein
MKSMSDQPNKSFRSFREFYPFYLSQHQHPVCRRLHFFGTVVALAVLGWGLLKQEQPWFVYLLMAMIPAYTLAWIGHFVFEKNKPATFQYPLYSLVADVVCFFKSWKNIF